jgi:hypothetical protein
MPMRRTRSIMALAVLVSLVGGAATAGMKGKDRLPAEAIASDSAIAASRPWVLYPDREDRARFRAYEVRIMRGERFSRVDMRQDQTRGVIR